MKVRISLAAVLAIAVACLLGPIVAGWFGLDGTTIDARTGATAPSLSHWFGTDTLGRDMLVRVMVGGRIALVVGLCATAIALVVGVAYGAVAGYAGGVVDEVMMRAVDALTAFPALVFVIVARATLGSSLSLLVILVGAIAWLPIARIVRAQVRALRHSEHVTAVRALGASPGRVIARHVIPNAAGPAIVYATIALPHIMLLEATLSFLGVGVQAPLASWGTLVTEGSSQIVVYPWLLACPGIAMAVAILALTFLGDALRDMLAP